MCQLEKCHKVLFYDESPLRFIIIIMYNNKNNKCGVNNDNNKKSNIYSKRGF